LPDAAAPVADKQYRISLQTIVLESCSR